MNVNLALFFFCLLILPFKILLQLSFSKIDISHLAQEKCVNCSLEICAETYMKGHFFLYLFQGVLWGIYD